MTSIVDELVAAILDKPSHRLLVVTGAGISLASGIPTFRGTDPDAVWNRETTEIGTFRYFVRDPVGWWSWVLGLRATVTAARPNPAHRALADLEHWHCHPDRGGRFLLVTQNIDTLHEQAGSRHMVKVHGSADLMRCSARGCIHGAPTGTLPASDYDLQMLAEDPVPENLPRCPICNALIRAHVLLFDEYYTEHRSYGFARVQAELDSMDLALFVGTSFSVGITDMILQSAFTRDVPVFSVDPGGHSPPAGLPIRQLREKAEVLLPALCRELGIGGAGEDQS